MPRDIITIRRRGGYFQPMISYTGPGDIVSGASAWYGLRAYSGAKAAAGVAAVRLADSTTAQHDIAVLSTGGLNLADSFINPGNPPFQVIKLYDQTGNGNDLTFHSPNAPPFNLTGNGLTLPNISFVAANSNAMNGAGFTFTLSSNPFTYLVVARHTASGTVEVIFGSFDAVGNQDSINANSGANTAYMYAQGADSVAGTPSDGSWHSLQAVFTASTSDVFQVDATSATGHNSGSHVPTNDRIIMGSTATGANFYDGFEAEAGIWPTGFSSGQLTSMYNNMHAYYGVF